MCSVTTGPYSRRRHKQIPEPPLAYVWALCSSNSYTKGRQAAQPQGPGGRQWDFCWSLPEPEGQVQTTSPPCRTRLQLKGEAVLNLSNVQQKKPNGLLSAVVVL